MEIDAQFWTALLQIIGINIVLSGDNAVVIAMACRSLPPAKRRWGIFLGAGMAIGLRIVFTIFIVFLLAVPYLKIAGALLLLWIGYHLVTAGETDDDVDAATNLWHAVRIILLADAVMSLDNVIAVAAAAKGNYILLVLGLVISVPLVVYGATLLVKLLNRFPVIIPGGAALIGYVAGEVVITDPMLRETVERHGAWLQIAAPLLGALLVVLAGKIVSPWPARPAVAEIGGGAAGSAFLFTLRSLLQVAGRTIAARAASVVAFLASLFGYAVVTEVSPSDAALQPVLGMLDALLPVFAATLAVGLGEIAAWAARRLRRPPSVRPVR
jgi:YjbE family integral membrane protein